MKIAVDINSCLECPFFKKENPYSTDGFDLMEDWMCGKSNKKIKGAVEWHEESKIQIPEWCEIKIEVL